MTTRSFEEIQDEEVRPPSLPTLSAPHPPPSLPPLPPSHSVLQTRYRVDIDFAASVKASAATAGVPAAVAVVTAAEVRFLAAVRDPQGIRCYSSLLLFYLMQQLHLFACLTRHLHSFAFV